MQPTEVILSLMGISQLHSQEQNHARWGGIYWGDGHLLQVLSLLHVGWCLWCGQWYWHVSWVWSIGRLWGIHLFMLRVCWFQCMIIIGWGLGWRAIFYNLHIHELPNSWMTLYILENTYWCSAHMDCSPNHTLIQPWANCYRIQIMNI